MKVLISFLAQSSDFIKGQNQVNIDGPTYQFHLNFFHGYSKHVLLSAAKEDDTHLEFLLNKLNSDFPTHQIEERYLNIKDVINLNEVKGKLEKLLLSLTEMEIDIFYSPGTSAMQVSWFLCHTTLGLQTRLLQTRAPRFTANKKAELVEIDISTSATTTAAILKERSLQIKEHAQEEQLITASIEPVFNNAYKIAQTDAVTTLIRGESGTGKEYLAHYIHENSARKHKPFKAINCSAMEDNLLESRLFGFKKGSFTDAKEDKPGLFEQAEGGTIFLDEIGDISPYMQQVLLRVIQEKEIEPIGALKPLKIDVRIIAATHRPLEKLCTEEKFRWDLYYRLAVAELELPSLRERGQEELKRMIDFFLKKKRKALKKKSTLRLQKEALSYLLHYPFPGNIRELENLIETLYVFNEEEVSLQDLPQRIKQIPEENSLRWEAVEKIHIEKVLRIFQGNQRQSAMAIGYAENTFKGRIKAYNIDMDTYK